MLSVIELHSRLNQIVECSTQLIFVAAETVSRQQKALTEFLSHQDDNTDVSFFKATQNDTSETSRRSIYSQITGKEIDLNSSTLKQLLKLGQSKADNEDLVLVCISQAELLKPDFVEELWDWVLDVDQCSCNTRLNVLLFCEPNWAKRTLKSISSNSKSYPILVSDNPKDTIGFDVNALESLMNDNHSWFSVNNRPIIFNKWFLSFVGSLFLLTFMSLMSLHYPNEKTQTTSNGLIEKSSNKPKSTDDYSNVGITNREEDNNIYSRGLKDKFELNVDTGNSAPSSANENALSNVAAETPESGNGSNIDSSNIANDAIVLAMKEHTSTPSANEVTNDKSLIASLNTSEKESNAIDFKVNDITTVEQLSVALFDNRNNMDAEKVSKNNTDITSFDYKFDETTLLALPKNAVVLQLSGIQNPVILENYIKNNNLETSTWVYETQRYGGSWYVVTYNQVFDSIESAVNNVPRLPDVIKESQPFAKSIYQIQREIRSK